MLKRLVFTTLFVLMLSPFIMGQQTNAKIVGTVTDNEGNPLPGVSVEATSPKMVGKATTITDENGSYRLLSLIPGDYKLTFSLEGFQTLVRESISVGLEQTITIKVSMTIGKIEEVVTVTAKAPLIDVKSTTRGMTLTKEVFASLPKGRNFDSLITVIPGISNEPLVAGTSVDGASGLENMYYIDGIDTTNLVTGRRGQAVAFDFVDEVQIKSSGYQAEFGGSLGGVINVVTRSGGNEFHGEVLAYFNPYQLRGKYPDTLSLDLDDPDFAKYYTYEYLTGKNKDYRIEAGVNMGGYIIRDKLWFYGSFLPIYYQNTRTVTHSDKAATVKDWKRTEQNWNYSFKLTSQPAKNLRLSASLVNNFYEYQGDLASRARSPNPVPSYDDYGFSFPNMSGSLSADLTIGNNFMVSLRGGFFKTNQNKQLVAPTEPCWQFSTEAPGGYYPTTNKNMAGIPDQYKHDTGWLNYNRANSFVVKNQVDERYSVGADFTYFLTLGGEHSWKAGVQFVHQGQNYDSTSGYPVIFLAWDREFKAYGTNYGRGTYGYYGVRGNDVTGPYGSFYKAYSDRWALYLQDSWTISNRLTINVGVRTESEYVPSYATGNPEFENLKAIEFGFEKKLAPRFGFVWDVKGDSSLKVYGSYGLFFDIFKLYMGSGSFAGFKWKSTYYTLDTYEWDKIGVNNYFPGTPMLPAPYTFDFRVPSFDTVDPDLQPMSNQEISLGVDKKLSENMSFSARLVQKHLRYAIEDVGVMTPEGEQYYMANPGYGWSLPTTKGGKFDPKYWECPKAKREYWGVNLAVDKRFSNNWMGGVSYTWSQLTGNYAGLASADEAGRASPNVERYFDLWYLAYDKSGKKIDGKQPTDRTHQFKAYGSYAFPFGMTAGFILNAFSGTPVSTEWAMDVAGYLPYNRGSLGRTPFLWFVNAYVEYNLKLGKNTLNISLNVDNLFNTRTATRVYQIYNQGGVGVPEDTILSTLWDIADYGPVLDPRYKQEFNFYGTPGIGTPIEARLGLKFAF